MQNIIEILPSNITDALGWTLVHSIWQSLLLLTLYQIASIMAKKSILKYNLGLGLIGMQVIASFATYLVIYEPVTAITATPELINYTQITNAEIAKQIQSTPIIYQLIGWFNTRLPIIVNIWILGLSFYLVRFGYNFWQVNQLKTNHLYQPSKEIVAIFTKIKAKLESPKAVQLMESARVYSPVLIGYLKPIILLPIGLCSQLSVQEIEAILAHELAHSKRNDYLVNLIQSIVDIVYFFNPALIILSNQVRDQRENCCDEFASDICGGSMPIARALISLESFRQESNLAMAFGRKGSSLKNRVHHILGISPEKANQNKGIFFIIGFIMVAIFYTNIENSIAQEPKTPKKPKTNKENWRVVEQKYSTYKDDGKHNFTQYNNGTQLNLYQKNGSVFLNGKEYKLPKEDSIKVAHYSTEIDKLNRQVEFHSSKIGELSNEIQKTSQKLNILPLGKKSEEMGILGLEIGSLAQKQADISQKMSKLDDEKDKKLIAELKAQEERYEKEINEIEKKMDTINDEMEIIRKGIGNLSTPLDSLSKLIEMHSAPIEALSTKIEEHSKEIWALYPEEVKAEYKKMMFDSSFNHYPKAPKPPKPPKVGSYPKPPLPPKAPRAPRGVIAPLAPVAPVAPLSPDTPVPPKAPKGPKSAKLYYKNVYGGFDKTGQAPPKIGVNIVEAPGEVPND